MPQSNGKMYRLKKPVVIPDAINISKSMYKMKHVYSLPKCVGDTYYGQQNLTSDIGLTNINSSDGLINEKKLQEPSGNVNDLENRQKIVLEKLRQLREKLEDLIQGRLNRGSLNQSVREVSEFSENRIGLISVIDNLKNELYRVKNMDDQAEQEALLAKLASLRGEVQAVAADSTNMKNRILKEETKVQQDTMIDIIDALKLLLRTEIDSLQISFQDSRLMDVKQDSQLKQLDSLRNQLQGVTKKAQTMQILAWYGLQHQQDDVVQIIGALQSLLRKDAHTLQICPEDDRDLERRQNALLKHLASLKDELQAITEQTMNIQTLAEEVGVQQQQDSIIHIIDALKLFLKIEFDSMQICDKDIVNLNIEKYHSEVMGLVDGLRSKLMRILKATDSLSLEIQTTSCSCNEAVEAPVSYGSREVVLSSAAPAETIQPNFPSRFPAVHEASEVKLVCEQNDLRCSEMKWKTGTLHDVVISASPAHPPYSLLALKKLLLKLGMNVHLTCSVHSSVADKIDPGILNLFQNDRHRARSEYDLAFTVVWKNQQHMSLMVSPISQSTITGEVNVLRYISRLFPAISPLNFEAQGSFSQISETDYWLDSVQSNLLIGDKKAQQSFMKRLNTKLGTSSWIDGKDSSLVDIFVWSVIHQLHLQENLPRNVAAWFKTLNELAELNYETTAEDGKQNNQQATVAGGSKRVLDRLGLESYLKELKIKYQAKDHMEVFTVDAMLKCISDMPGLHMKNLFLKDKKGSLYMLVARHDAQVNMSDVAKQTGIKDLRFGDENIMYDILGIRQGCVTVFALINDTGNRVKLLLDAEAMNTKHKFVNFHPLTNSATLGISPNDLKVFLRSIDHEPAFVLNF